MKLRFIGDRCEIGGHPLLDRFGQTIDLPVPLARDLILGGGSAAGWAGASALLPDDRFQAVGFTDVDLKDFSMPGSHADAPVEFKNKKTAALVALHMLREEIEAGAPFGEAE